VTNAPPQPNRAGAREQNDPMLATKCFIPSPRANWIARPRLTQQLDQGSERKLTLLSAPAGFGKTTLLSSWIKQRHLAVAWLSLDAGDNDPGRFLSYVIAALETRHAGIGETAALLLQSPQRSLESVVTLLINALSTRPDAMTLVLDDYHVVDAPPVHSALTFLLDHAPPQLHLILATRGDPPLPLARLRARGELTELRAAELRFTTHEASAFLNQAMALYLAPEQIAALEERTEGWIAGLQLAALSLQGRDAERISAFIQAFTGSHHYIMDYLVEEVLGRQPEQIQTFLLRTSILDRLSGSLCDAVTGQNDSQTLLERLERANLFVFPLEEERRWYRYHHLFADLLRYRLHQSQPNRVFELQRRASEWYERTGLAVEAIQHALAANDFERAARLIAQAGGTMLRHGESTTLAGWLEVLPDDVVRSQAQLCVVHAWALLFAGQWDALELRLQDAERSVDAHATQLPSAEIQDILGQAAAIRATVAINRGDIGRTIELCHQALEGLPENNLLVRGVVSLVLGAAYELSGDVVAASQAWSEASTLSQASGNTQAALTAIHALAKLQVIQGHLRQAAESYQQAMQLGVNQDGRPLPAVGAAYVGLGDLLREWNDLSVAARHVAQGIELCKLWANMSYLADGYVTFAHVFQAQGDAAGALDMIQQAERMVQMQQVSHWIVSETATCQAQLWLMQGNMAAATRWAQEAGLRMEDEPGFGREAEHIAWTRVLIAQHRPAEAQQLLARWLPAAEAGGRIGHVIGMLILQSLALHAQDETAAALTTLERALSLAEPEGYIRTFVDEGEPMAKLLGRINVSREGGRLKDYVRKLLFAFGKEETLHPSALIAHPSLVEPLSERELQVLRLVAAGASNREIAKALIVTVGTVKAHMHHIYGKLGVQSRTQAIARARALHLW
jgi:LuxR family maltose regulon positive regulatory protein